MTDSRPLWIADQVRNDEWRDVREFLCLLTR